MVNIERLHCSLSRNFLSGLPEASYNPFCNIRLVHGDITKLQVDAIVNAANNQLRGGDGVCGAIFKAAGRNRLQAECDLYIQGGGCATGDAILTSAHNLKAKGIDSIIHAVGPKVTGPQPTDADRTALARCYRRSLELATQAGHRSIVSKSYQNQ